MSAFLGPIHHWMYNKILFQDNLTSKILSEYDKDGLTRDLAKKYGEPERAKLEDIIDNENIHGWLQERVSLVEIRLAEAVTVLLANNKAALSDLEKLAFEFGKANKPAPPQKARELYAFLNNTLLDGMPCDRVNELLTETKDEVVWHKTQCIHKSYWDAAGGDIENYYKLRTALISGLTDGLSFTYEELKDNTFRIIGGAKN